jgi:hypothetical protein
MIEAFITIFSILAGAAALKAAIDWRKASDVPVDPGYTYPGCQPTYQCMGMTLQRVPESGIPELNQASWTAAIMAAQVQSSGLNAAAAWWANRSARFALLAAFTPVIAALM